MSMIFPMCISLIAGYMISREQTDDTLKNILTVPISFKKLLTGKLIVCGVLSIIFGLICSLFTIIAEMIVGFPGFEISLALKAALQITAVNFFLYLAVLPIIALTCRRAGSFLVGVIIAFVYGYGGMFAAGNMTLANLYPITASLGMVGYRSYDITFTGAFGREALLLYKTENLSSSILGKISSANIFAHELSSAFFSRAVSENTLSLKDICWLLFTLNDINLTTLQIYNHYNTIDLGVVRLAAYSIFRNFLYF